MILDLIDHLFDGFRGDGALLAGGVEAHQNFLTVIRFAAAIGLDYGQGNGLYIFVGSVSLSTAQALATTTNGLAFAAAARIHDLVFFTGTERTFHRVVGYEYRQL